MSATMHIGLLGPATLRDLRQHLFASDWHDGLPVGTGGTPVNLLASELVDRGVRVTVFTVDPAIDREVVVRGPLLKIVVVPLGKPPGRRPARDFFAVERHALIAAVQREAPDVLHAHWTTFYALAAQAAGLPHVITAHDATLRVLRHEFTPYRIAHTVMAYGVTARARRVVAVSPYVARHLRRYMLYRGPTIVVPNGLPASVFDLARTRPEREATTFGTVLSGWTKLKNGMTAIGAFARIRSEFPGVRLVMLGHGHGPDGPAAEWAKHRCADAGIEFAGQVPHREALARLARDVDVFVHPSVEEACSMALAEASAIGIPSIAGRRSGGVPYSLDDGRAGLLVDVTNASELAAAMRRVLCDRALRHRLGAAANEYARRTFHIHAVASAYLDLYAELRSVGRAA